MENEGRLKLIVAGLVLAAFAIGYFILAQRFQGGSSTATPSPSAQPNIVLVTPSPRPSGSASVLGQANTGSGNNSMPNTGAAEVSTLPRTGFPLPVAVSIASAAIVSGWFLRRYPY